MRRFHCTLCGECCKLSPVSLLPYEDIILRRIASRLRLPYRSRPGYRVYDKNHNIWLSLSYAMLLVKGKCPFLAEDNKCRINDIYKPLICRSYPYVPRQITYTVSRDLRIVFSQAEYGISIHCPVVRDDKLYIESLMRRRPDWPQIYMPTEYKAAVEFEEKRKLLLDLLSNLWARGIVDLREEGPRGTPIINLYEMLRRFYPNLPYILRINRILSRIG